MKPAANNVILDDDVDADLRKLAERSGRSVVSVVNEALRDYLRYEKTVTDSVERGLADLDAGRTRTTAEVIAFLEEQRAARSQR